jgi:midasin (ATPase involved in ribosome maturation)
MCLLHSACQRACTLESSYRFEWVDGTLTRAVEQGSWVLLRGANLAAPAVLDRLNALLEPGGTLVLNEAGSPGGGGPRVVTPHPDFRLILALNPRWGCQTVVRVSALYASLLVRSLPWADWLHDLGGAPDSFSCTGRGRCKQQQIHMSV